MSDSKIKEKYHGPISEIASRLYEGIVNINWRRVGKYAGSAVGGAAALGTATYYFGGPIYDIISPHFPEIQPKAFGIERDMFIDSLAKVGIGLGALLGVGGAGIHDLVQMKKQNKSK